MQADQAVSRFTSKLAAVTGVLRAPRRDSEGN